MSRRIEDLHPQLQLIAASFLEECEHAGIDVLITCTYRTMQEQAALYAQGRTKPGRIVTRAKPGQSSHNYTINGQPSSLAFDVVPLRYGKAIWGTGGNGMDDNPTDDASDDLELWQRVGQIGKALGLQWYGDSGAPFREMPHFQLPNASEIMRSGAA